MKSIERCIVINAPIRRVYDHWTRFENYRQFVPGHLAVQRLGRRDVLWKARVWGIRTKWRTVIDETKRDELVAWHGTVRHPQNGTVTFEHVGPHKTQINLTLEYHTRGWVAKTLDLAGVVSFLVDSTMKRFQRYIEAKTSETESEVTQFPIDILETPAAYC